MTLDDKVDLVGLAKRFQAGKAPALVATLVKRDLLDPSRIHVDTKLDTKEMDALILKALPDARLESGLRYVRWAVYDGLAGVPWAKEQMVKSNADGYFIGKVMGKDLTILFFGDTLES